MNEEHQTLSDSEKIRHSRAHILAMAVLKKFPKAKLGIGPVIENGFYYDFELPRPLTEKEILEIESLMKDIVGENLPFIGEPVTPAQAKKLFKDQPFKLELIKDFVEEEKSLTVYHTGADFFDLCRGGHVKNTKEIDPNSFKLLSVAGAYWKGSEKNPMLTRIYAASFETKEELASHLNFLEEAKKRDHRKLGKELELFIFSDLVGPGLPLFTPKGTIILNLIKDYSRKLRNEIGYEEVQTPNINKGELFKVSGHYEKFKNDMFRVHSNYAEEEYFLKPMNCPQATQLYGAKMRSYRDLPLRFADMAILYRDEKPGELAGLTRLRAFSQDDAHTFLREDQIGDEFALLLSAVQKAMARYGLTYHIRLSLRDPNNKKAYRGSDEVWERSQKILKDLLLTHDIKHVEAEGEAAFYGPKMDLMVKDSLGRTWQLSTIQLDFNQPERFELEYTDADGSKKRPVMIHSALVGSPERFFGIIIEHFAGAFPFWLAPIQIQILTVNDSVANYAKTILDSLRNNGIRAALDARNETIGKKIREGELQKIPYLLIIGPKEKEANTIAVRERGKGDTGQIDINGFLARIKKEEI
jgi:threonyl-tRNA synthetase